MELLVFSFFIFLFLFVGRLSLKHSNATEEDYLTGNRSFGRVLIALSAGALTLSSFLG